MKSISFPIETKLPLPFSFLPLSIHSFPSEMYQETFVFLILFLSLSSLKQGKEGTHTYKLLIQHLDRWKGDSRLIMRPSRKRWRKKNLKMISTLSWVWGYFPLPSSFSQFSFSVSSWKRQHFLFLPSSFPFIFNQMSRNLFLPSLPSFPFPLSFLCFSSFLPSLFGNKFLPFFFQRYYNLLFNQWTNLISPVK